MNWDVQQGIADKYADYEKRIDALMGLLSRLVAEIDRLDNPQDQVVSAQNDVVGEARRVLEAYQKGRADRT